MNGNSYNQPLAFQLDLLEELVEKLQNGDYNTISLYFKLITKLKDFHVIYFDNSVDQNGSIWFEKYVNILENAKVNKQIAFNYLNGTFIREFVKMEKVNINQINEDNIDYQIAQATPDKLLLCKKNVEKNINLNYYSSDRFINEKYGQDCILYRLPKNQEFRAGSVIKNFDFLKPYFRNCKNIEIFDNYLFRKRTNKVDSDFIRDIIKLVEWRSDLKIYFDMNPLSLSLFNEFKECIHSVNPNIIINKPEQYSKQRNHDRFIILDKDRISLRFTTSFNNYKRDESGFYKVLDNSSIIYTRGRSYED